jgi:hypothetical protein
MTRYTTIIHIHEQRSSQGTSRVCPSWPRSKFRLSPLWPHPVSMHLVATPNLVSSCLLQWFKLHPNIFCYLGGFSLMYKQTSQQRHTIQGRHDKPFSMTIHILLSTLLPFSWAGWLSSIPSVHYTYNGSFLQIF